MDKRTEQAFAYLEKNEHSMMELLKNLVSIETPSADREANERIAAHLDTYCDSLGMERQIHHFEKAGPTFAAWTRPQEKRRSRFFCSDIWIRCMRSENLGRNRFL